MLQASASGNHQHALWSLGKPGDTLVEPASKDPKWVAWVSRTANRDKLNRAGVVVPTAAAQEAEVKAHLAARAVGRESDRRVNEAMPAAVKASKAVEGVEEDHVVEAEGVGAVAAGELWY